MIRFRRLRILVGIIIFIAFVIIVRLLNIPEYAHDHARNKKYFSDHLENLSIIVQEFEEFDNDVFETIKSVLSACLRKCRVFVISEKVVYPPLSLPKNVAHIVLSPDLFRSSADLSQIKKSKYVFYIPDGSRLSSLKQLMSLIEILESGDTEVIAVRVGGNALVCQRFNFNIPSWTLSIVPAPDSEACDGVKGRAALLMHTSDLFKLTHLGNRPTTLSIAIQGTARGWKMRIARGIIFGEGRQLFSTDHLQWKLQTVEEERKKYLFKVLGIKKIVGEGRKVEWYGCTRSTQRCFPTIVNDTPSYIYEGRWTPPCCLEGLRTTARHVFQTLRSCRVRWWLEGGSLLGAVRYNDIIPWDYDTDIGIYSSDVGRCPQLKQSQWQTLEDTDGYVWQRASEGDFYRVHYSIANHLHVDIFPFTAVDGIMTRGGGWSTGHKQDVDFPEHFLRPFASISFAGFMASCPNNVRDFLELKFGPGVVENPQYPNPDVLSSLNISLPTPR